MSTRPSKIPTADAFNILLAYDKPINTISIILGYLVVMLSTPFWLAPLLGLPMLPVVFFLALYFILSVALLHIVKVRADLLQARAHAKRIADLTGRYHD